MSTLFTRENLFHLVKELIWLLITTMVIMAILYPITSKVDYIYWKINSLFIFITLTYFRYSLTLRSLPFLRPTWVRFGLFAVNLSLFIYLMGQEQKLLMMHQNFYIEDFGFPKVIMYDDVKEAFFKYLYRDIVFFGTGSLGMIIAFQLRLIVSYWQLYKHQSDTLLES